MSWPIGSNTAWVTSFTFVWDKVTYILAYKNMNSKTIKYSTEENIFQNVHDHILLMINSEYSKLWLYDL